MRMLLRKTGNTLEAWTYSSGTWTLEQTVTDSAYTGGEIGLQIRDASFGNGGGAIDDFGGTGTTTSPPPPPTVPQTSVLDSFNRADETPVSQGAQWGSKATDAGGQLKVLSNVLQRVSGNGSAYRIREYEGDMEAFMTIVSNPGNLNGIAVAVDLQDVGTSGWDGYTLRLHRSLTSWDWNIYRFTNGSGTSLASWGLTPAAGNKILLRRIGSKLEAWRYNGGAWTLMQSVTDTTYQRGKIGAQIFDAGHGGAATADDFGGGSLGQTVGYEPPPEQSIGVCDGSGRNALSDSVCLADPVNTLTGAFTYSLDDLSLPGTGVAFDWERSYTSSDPTVGRLGRGWTDSYAVSLAIAGSGDVTLHGDEGQQVTYQKQPDGSFVGAPGARSVLSTTAGGYLLVRSDQVVYTFDSQGRMTSEKDRNGAGLSFSYDGQGRLQTITDAAGREASVSYNGDDLVSGVSTADGRSIAYGYTDGLLTSYTDPRGKTWTYTYDDGDRLETIVDPLNHTQIDTVYGTDGRVSTQTDALAKTTTFAWDPETETATVTDANGSVWTDDYDSGLLASQIDPLSEQTQYFYDADLNRTLVNGPTGDVTRMSYDAAGNLLQATAPPSLGGVQKTTVFDTANDPTQVTDARGKVTSYTYDTQGNVATVTQDGTQVASYTYDGVGRVLTSTDGNAKTTTNTYDADGNLASSTDALGDETTYTYDDAGRLLTRVDPNGNCSGCTPSAHTTTYTYDDAGNLLTETDPLGEVTTHTYDDAGNGLTVTDANGHSTTNAYDDANRLTSVTAPDGGVTSYTYDDVGNKLTETDPRNHTTTSTYDDANRLASETTATGAKTTYAYDSNGNLVKEVDPRGNAQGANPSDYATLSTYDAAGRLLTETDPLGDQTTHVYDAVGNEVSVTDPRGKTTTSVYDGLNRLTSVTAPDGGVTAYTYDPVGNKLTETDPRGKTTTSTYDGANRLASETSPTGDETTYSYDSNGNKTAMVDPRGNAQGANPADFTWQTTYDAANRKLTETDPLGDVTTYTYDDVGNELSQEDANSHTTSYTYDPADRLETVTAPDLGVTSYGYDLAGDLTSRTDANNHQTTYAYDSDNRRTSVTSPLGQVWTTTYDPAGNVSTQTDANGNATQTQGDGQTSYSYDHAGRLTKIDYSDATPDVSFSYDADGNRTSMADGVGLSLTPSSPTVDNFNRADENPVSQAGAWSSTGTTGSTRLKVVSNQLASSSSSTSRSHRVGTMSDLEAYVTIAVKPGSGNPVGITFCNRDFGASTWDGYRLVWTDVSGASNDTLAIQKVTNGTATSLQSTTLEYAAGTKLGVRRLGATIEAWVDTGSGWQKALTASDATYPDGTLGLEVKGTTGRLDDFAAQAVGESATYDDANRLTSLTRGRTPSPICTTSPATSPGAPIRTGRRRPTPTTTPSALRA